MAGRILYLAFALSGAAGLAYEVVWSRYLALFVGNSAYAQVLVLAVYLGGMSVGAFAVGDLGRKIRRPLLAYALAEGILAALGLLFHPAFQWATGVSYQSLLPALGDASWASAARWGVSALLVLPPAVVLGATFPFMAAGLVRMAPSRPGHGVAGAYLANTLGGAAGVLVAGFATIPALGLPGALAVAAALNAVAGLLAFGASRGEPAPAAAPGASTVVVSGGAAVSGDGGGAPVSPGLTRLVLAVSFGTALASFAYEIGWIRLLSMVLSSATHAFEIMLSAFLLGLGLGAVLIRNLADENPHPLRLLGRVQWAMGPAALATLPFYIWVFDAMGYVVTTLSTRSGGYFLFNLSRYSLAMAVMLPATVLAGTTLPLMIGGLLRAGGDEGVIGRVVGVNTLGSVVGAMAAGLVGLPLLGLKGVLVVGAGIDMLLGAWLLAATADAGRRRTGALVGAGGLAVCVALAMGLKLDPTVLTSGVFRYGRLPRDEGRKVLYYHDGRTASVGVHWRADSELLVLTTNGKPDASMGPRWFDGTRGEGPPRPLEARRDATTQVLAPLIALAYAPRAHQVVNVGHGSGMSGTTLLSGNGVDELVTVEIEPSMVEASLSFLPLNQRVFDDPRSAFVFDDARAYLAYRARPADLVFAEPSNPWVSGTSSLFTIEFYAKVRRHLAPGGILAQWIQLYEIDDDLVLSVLAAVGSQFPSYRGYLVGDLDLLIVASADPLPDPDWSVMALPAAREVLKGVPPFLPQHLDPLLLFDDALMRPIVDGHVEANSDFRPILDSRAEWTRFRRRRAVGFQGLGADRVSLRRVLSGVSAPPDPDTALVPAAGLTPAVNRGLSAWLQVVERARGGIAPESYPGWQDDLTALRDYYAALTAGAPPEDWPAWTRNFEAVEVSLHTGTAGWADTTFYGATQRYLDAVDAPVEARAVVHLFHGTAAWDFEEAAAAAPVLVDPVSRGAGWLDPAMLSDAAVTAYLKTGRPQEAGATLASLAGVTGREPGDVRTRILEAWIRRAGG